MDANDRMVIRRMSLKERLGLRGMGCCGGSARSFGPSSVTTREDDGTGIPQVQQIEVVADQSEPLENSSVSIRCVGQIPSASTMNLAAALAAERHLRAAAQDGDRSVERPSPSPPRPISFFASPEGTTTNAELETETPLRMSLMRLLEESDGGEGLEETETLETGVGCDSMCCVCMASKKGAAFIPCGHTYCRVCSRELWLSRGSCPLCNRPILEVLDIF